MAKNEVANVSWYYVPNLGTSHYLCGGGGGGLGGNHGVGQANFNFREKGWAKRDFHDGWGVGHCVVCKESHSLQFMWKI